MKRRDLSGIFIFDQFEGEEKRQPTCFEDCTEATQDKWLDTLEIEALKNLSKQLAGTLIDVADFAGITRNEDEQSIIDYNAMEEESEMDNYNKMKNEQQ